MSIFYHTTNTELKIGTLIPVKYGETLRDPDYFRSCEHNYTHYLREMIFEEVRKSEFCSLPSRLESIYLVNDLNVAIVYRKKFKLKYVYEVEIEEPGRMLTADMTWIDLSTRQHYSTLKQLAYNYFSEARSANAILETLYDGPVRVINRL